MKSSLTLTLDTSALEAAVNETLSLFEDVRRYLSDEGISYLGSLLDAAGKDIPEAIDVPATGASAFTLGVSVSRNFELFRSTVGTLHSCFKQNVITHGQVSGNTNLSLED
jgi:hypothetical protein